MSGIATAVAVVGAAGSVYSGNKAESANKQAGWAQQKAANEANARADAATQMLYERLDPYSQLGSQTFNPLLAATGLQSQAALQSQQADIQRQIDAINSGQADRYSFKDITTEDLDAAGVPTTKQERRQYITKGRAGRGGGRLKWGVRDVPLTFEERVAKAKEMGVQTERVDNLANLQSQLQDVNTSLQFVPELPERVDLSKLPEQPKAFDPVNVAQAPGYQFLLDEGFRGINEGGAGGGRNVDRDLVKFAQGTAATYLPQLQQQQYTQQAANRATALAEQSGLRADANQENQQRINNLLELLGYGQSSAAGMGKAGINQANQIGSNLMTLGNQQATNALNAGVIAGNRTSNLLGAIGTGLGAYQGYQNRQANIGSDVNALFNQPGMF